MSTEVTRIPFLGAIPFIGPRFFSAKVATQDETELLILVTPEIVRPMDADEVPPVPGHEVTHPSDWELYHAAMTEGAPNTGYFQLAPYGRGGGPGIDVGYRLVAAIRFRIFGRTSAACPLLPPELRERFDLRYDE
jgi:pilus assembly protein CpaC